MVVVEDLRTVYVTLLADFFDESLSPRPHELQGAAGSASSRFHVSIKNISVPPCTLANRKCIERREVSA
jgi:hypothetical protein